MLNHDYELIGNDSTYLKLEEKIIHLRYYNREVQNFNIIDIYSEVRRAYCKNYNRK